MGVPEMSNVKLSKYLTAAQMNGSPFAPLVGQVVEDMLLELHAKGCAGDVTFTFRPDEGGYQIEAVGWKHEDT
jgi:hypothetical protein